MLSPSKTALPELTSPFDRLRAEGLCFYLNRKDQRRHSIGDDDALDVIGAFVAQASSPRRSM